MVRVGDGRIYQLLPGLAEQVTEDDVETKTLRQDTRTSLPGVPSTYRRNFLTQAPSGNYDLDISVSSSSFSPGEGLALATDGAYPLGGFEPKLRRVFERPDMEGTLGKWFNPQSLGNEDDATLALLRRSGLTQEREELYLDLLDRLVDCRDHRLYPHLMARVLIQEIGQALKDGDESRVDLCARYMQRFSIQPGRDVLGGFLDRIADNSACGRDTFERVLELARRSR